VHWPPVGVGPDKPHPGQALPVGEVHLPSVPESQASLALAPAVLAERRHRGRVEGHDAFARPALRPDLPRRLVTDGTEASSTISG
jgi:hypothetical protein